MSQRVLCIDIDLAVSYLDYLDVFPMMGSSTSCNQNGASVDRR